MRYRLAALASTLALIGIALGIAASDDDPPSEVDTDISLSACPGELGENTATAISAHFDYPSNGGVDSPEAALASAATTLKMPGLIEQASRVQSNSSLARFELSDGHGAFLVANRNGRWMLDKYSMCQSKARELYQP